MSKAKPIELSKREVWNAWKRVKRNRGAAGVDEESLEEFENKLERNLYKLWNRMSSGSYFPQAVRRVAIPKKDGSSRPLGIPTVYDRVAQEVVRARLEAVVEPMYHRDSYGYRPGKSAIDAISVCRERNWKYDWVLDLDIQKFFDTISHEKLMKAVKKHVTEKWEVLYIERWLKAPVRHADGKEEASTSGTPQGGVISPLLANLYLHYAFDRWISEHYPQVKFERFADDAILHCESEQNAKELKIALSKRFAGCGLTLHPTKTQIVYCKDSNRKEDYPIVSYTFLGYTFRPRAAKNKHGQLFTAFLPAASRDAQKRFRQKLREKWMPNRTELSVTEIANIINPIVRGWYNYFGHYGRHVLGGLTYYVSRLVLRWVMKKYRYSKRRALRWYQRLRVRGPDLFAHWNFTPANG